jgi:hypothetical protein
VWGIDHAVGSTTWEQCRTISEDEKFSSEGSSSRKVSWWWLAWKFGDQYAGISVVGEKTREIRFGG